MSMNPSEMARKEQEAAYEVLEKIKPQIEVLRVENAEREKRLIRLIAESNEILDRAIDTYVTQEGKKLKGTCLLFSGGNDSTTMSHILRNRASHAIHANTTVGIEATRQFVRDMCAEWELPLIEKKPPREQDHYEALVLDRGFPGPAHHFKMYTRLKERALHAARNELIEHPRRERVVFVAGRRREESKRRANVPEMERRGSIVWCSPMVNWTKADLTFYRMIHNIPRNPVTDILHMSGECLCLSFAHPGERQEITDWYPEFVEWIESLEEKIKDREDIPEEYRKWGWGAYKEAMKKKSKSGPLCSTCDTRMEAALANG